MLNHLGNIKKIIVIIISAAFAYTFLIITPLVVYILIEESVSKPATYGTVNIVSCHAEQSLMETLEKDKKHTCWALNIKESECTIGSLKNASINYDKDKYLGQSQILISIPFILQREYLYPKKLCKLKKDTKKTGAIFTPKKQTNSEIIGTTLNIASSLALQAVLSSRTKPISKEFKTECIKSNITKKECTEKYIEFAEILKNKQKKYFNETYEKHRNHNLSHDNITYIKKDYDETQSINNRLQSALTLETQRQLDPYSSLYASAIINIDKTNILDLKDINFENTISSIHTINTLFPSMTKEIRTLSFIRAVEAVLVAKTAYKTQHIVEIIEEAHEKYKPCISIKNCTKETFESQKYNVCLNATNEILTTCTKTCTENNKCSQLCKFDINYFEKCLESETNESA